MGGPPEDPVVQALTTLSDVAASSADDLIGLNEDLAVLRNHRVRGESSGTASFPKATPRIRSRP